MSNKRQTIAVLANEINEIKENLENFIKKQDDSNRQIISILKSFKKSINNEKKRDKEPTRMGEYNAFVKHSYARAEEINASRGDDGPGALSVVAEIWKQFKDSCNASIAEIGSLSKEDQKTKDILFEIIENTYTEKMRIYNERKGIIHKVNESTNASTESLEDSESDVEEKQEVKPVVKETSFTKSRGRRRTVKKRPRPT